MALTPSEMRRRKMNLLMAMSYAAFASSKASAWSPTLLFAAGEQGAWYDPSDFSTMFQNSTGTTPVTAVEQPVGLLLDKSKGLVLGSELWGATSDYSAGTGTSSDVGGVITISGTDSVNRGRRGVVISSLTIGRSYQITFNVSSFSGVSAAISIASGVSNSGVLAISTTGSYRYVYVADATSRQFTFFTGSSGATATIGSISIRELPGNHATQATSASCPVLSARVNQLLATATLSTQNVTTLAATYTLAFSGAGTVTATGTNIGVYSAGSNSLVCTAGTLTLTVVGSVTLADLRVTNDGVGLPAYQAVVTSTNYDTSGFPLYLKFDGTDDSLATASIDFTATDKMSVFAGVRKLSDAARGIVVELSTGTGVSGNFNLNAPNSAAANYAFRCFGTAQSDAISASSFAAPTTDVLTALADIVGDAVTLRSDGVQVATNSADLGTGSFGNYPLYVGRRNNATLPLNAHLYSLIIRGALSTDAQIASTETWVNGKTGAY